MIISENHFGKENCVAYCDVLIRRNYEVINADEHFYHFVEKLVGINFLDIVHQDNLKDFKMAFETLKPGENCRMLILLRNGIGEYYWTDMVIYNNGKILSGENVIEVRCYFLSAVESRYLMALDNVNKYRTILSTYRNYLFDYNSYTDMFTIYLYRGNQCNAPIKGTLEQFRERMLRILRSDSERKEFATFYNYLKNGSNMFSCMVYLPLDEHNDELYKFKVNGDSLFSINKTSVVAGYLETVDGCVSDVIPYYATSEAVDSATGLLNKRACMEYTKSVIASKDDKIHYMIMFDVDNFKSINDTYGHALGDEVIKAAAKVLKDTFRSSDIVGRAGGDEFMVLMKNVRWDKVIERQMLELCRKFENLKIESIPCGAIHCSIGAAYYPDHGMNFDELYHYADEALYEAKRQGRNTYVIYHQEKENLNH